jgi:hypothetical protein
MVIFMKNEKIENIKELNYYVPTDSINGGTEYVLVNYDEFVSKKNKED